MIILRFFPRLMVSISCSKFSSSWSESMVMMFWQTVTILVMRSSSSSTLFSSSLIPGQIQTIRITWSTRLSITIFPLQTQKFDLGNQEGSWHHRESMSTDLTKFDCDKLKLKCMDGRWYLTWHAIWLIILTCLVNVQFDDQQYQMLPVTLQV